MDAYGWVMIIGAVGTALGAVINSWHQASAIKTRVAVLEAQHADCLRENAELKGKLSTLDAKVQVLEGLLGKR